MKAYKLFRVRRDGSIGPLFINRKQRIPTDTWLQAEDHPTKGFEHRPGWHVSCQPRAPHLSKKGRRWYLVEIDEFKELSRPKKQGGLWYIAQWMRVIESV
jgi:hypothetical protein